MTDSLALLSADAAAFGRATAALVVTESEHLPRVLDVTALGDRRELVLEDIDGPTLTELLARRSRLAAGEAVTVILSVARAIAALHRAGYCRVVLDGDALRFDATGRPLVLGLGELRETIQLGAAGPADDWRAVAALAERLGLLPPSRTGGALGGQHVGLSLAFAALGGAESDEHLAQLEDALFELADPAPVRFDGAVDPAPPVNPAPRVMTRTPAPSAPVAGRGPTARASAESRRRAAHRRPSASALIEAIDAGPSALLAGPLGRVREATVAIRSRFQGRARLVVIVVAGAAALTLGATALMPRHAPAASSQRVPAAPAGATAATGRTEPTRPVEPTGPAASPHVSPRATSDPRLAGDDPVAAASALLVRRDACLSESDAVRADCLARVADGGASDLDQPPRPLADLTPSLLERAGDSALIALTPTETKTAPASALLMRTEAGWRLRQLYEN